MLDSKHVQELSFFFFAATQGWNDVWKVGYMEEWMGGV